MNQDIQKLEYEQPKIQDIQSKLFLGFFDESAWVSRGGFDPTDQLGDIP